MLKLTIIHQYWLVKTVIVDNKQASLLDNSKPPVFLNKQIKTLLNFYQKVVKIVQVIVDEFKVNLLVIDSTFNCCESEALDSHRGSGRIESCDCVL